MNRRDLIKAAPVALVGCTLPVQAETETPVMKAYREWKACRDWIDSETGGMADEEFDAICDLRRDMEFAMFDLPNADLRDAALKLLAYTDCGHDFAEDGYGTASRLMREMRALVEGKV